MGDLRKEPTIAIKSGIRSMVSVLQKWRDEQLALLFRIRLHLVGSIH